MDSNIDSPLYRYRFGTVSFDESRFELLVGGLVVELEQKPLQVLMALLSRVDEVWSRQELLDSVWGGRVTVDNVLYNAVRKLRIAVSDEDGERIVTVPKLGYKLVGPIERTAVGRKLFSRLQLQAKQFVAGREAFVLDEQIGVTLASEVWLAHHIETHEKRVYKFCIDGARLSSLRREAKLGRFLRESLQDREDITRIIDWNFETLPFYLECEYGGNSLAAWAADGSALAAMAQPERIALFLQAADAVAAAHSVGVLHKDLKPANILIAPSGGGHWQVRVTDFGSGGLLEPGRLEEFGMTQLGLTATIQDAAQMAEATPMYIAPEIISGSAPTVQSDLYALGLILYQMIINDLRRPMAPGWESQIADDLLRDDISAATYGEAAHRLMSVAELAHRLRTLDQRRLLQSEGREIESRLVNARRAAERTRARRPWLILAMGSLVLGLSVSLWLYKEQRLARLESEREERRTDEINIFLTQDLLGAADPTGPGGAHNPTMRDVLAATAARLDWAFTSDPEIKASIDVALGSAYFGISDYPNAEKYREAAFDLLKRVKGPEDSATLEAEYPLIAVYVQTNRLDEAGAMLDSADRLAGKRLLEDTKLSYNAHWARAAYEKLRMAPDKALVEYLAADKVRAVITPYDPSMIVRLRDALSWCYARLNRNDDAERVLRDVMTPAYTPERVGPAFWSQARIDYGVALKTLNRDGEAEKYLVDALSEIRRSLGPDHFFVGVVENEIGDLYVREKRWSDAADDLRDAYAIFRRHSGDHGQATLIVGANLGIVELHTGHLRQAIPMLASIHDDLASTLGASSPQAEIVAYYLAYALSEVGRYQEADGLISPITAANLAAAEPRDDWDSRLGALKGDLQIGLGHTDAGVATLTAAISRMQDGHTPEDDLAPFRDALRRATRGSALQ